MNSIRVNRPCRIIAAFLFIGSVELFFFLSLQDDVLPAKLLVHLCTLYAFFLIYELVLHRTLYKPCLMMARDANAYHALPQAAVLLDQHGRIQQVNKAACQEVDAEQNALLGQHCHSLFHPAYLNKESCPVCQALHTGKVCRSIELEMDKARGWRRFRLSAVETGKKSKGMVQVSTDINQQKQVEAELEATLYNLDRKVARRTQEFHAKVMELEQTRDHLVANEKMASLGRLVAGFAHEINTPIGIAVGAASQLQDAAREINRMLASEEVDEEDMEEVLEIIAESTGLTLSNLHRAAELIHRFKRSSIDRTSEKLRHFRVRELVEDVLLSLHNMLKKKPITVVVDCPEELRIISVPGLIEQVLVNLIQNSIIHGFENGTLSGEIHISCNTLDNFHMEYRDNGKGMSAEVVEHLFEPFYTTKRGSGSDSGSGLGMYISYNLVHRHHGVLYCESEPGQGVWFSLDLPVGTMADLEQAVGSVGYDLFSFVKACLA